MYNKVTISGKICTGKSTLFSQLQQKLGWPTFSASAYFRDYAKSHGTSLQKAEEQNPNLTKEVDFGMLDRLKKEGHVIIEGWMAGIMAKEVPDVLRILLTCDDVVRIKRFANREGVSEEEAKTKIEEREASLFAKLEEIYHRTDFVDPKNYNLIIDTTKISTQQALDAVFEKLK